VVDGGERTARRKNLFPKKTRAMRQSDWPPAQDNRSKEGNMKRALMPAQLKSKKKGDYLSKSLTGKNKGAQNAAGGKERRSRFEITGQTSKT